MRSAADASSLILRPVVVANGVVLRVVVVFSDGAQESLVWPDLHTAVHCLGELFPGLPRGAAG